MQLSVEIEKGDRLDTAVGELVGKEPSVAYANFPPIAEREGTLRRLHEGRWRRADLGAFVVRDAAGQPLASSRLEHRGFESDHFGMPMAKIEPPLAVADESLRPEALRALYRGCFDSLAERGYEHVAVQCSAADRACGWVLQELDAFYVGTRITWMASLTGAANDHRLAPGLRFATYERAAIADVDPASWRRLLEWSGKGFDRGPLVLDCGLPHDLSRRVYEVWTDKAMRGEWAQALLLVYDGPEVVAFHTMMMLDDLSEAADQVIVGRGIGATLPGYRGLFTALQKETIARRPLGASYLENETQSGNVQSIYAFGRLGHPCLRSTATFHLHLGRRGVLENATSVRYHMPR